MKQYILTTNEQLLALVETHKSILAPSVFEGLLNGRFKKDLKQIGRLLFLVDEGKTAYLGRILRGDLETIKL